MFGPTTRLALEALDARTLMNATAAALVAPAPRGTAASDYLLDLGDVKGESKDAAPRPARGGVIGVPDDGGTSASDYLLDLVSIPGESKGGARSNQGWGPWEIAVGSGGATRGEPEPETGPYDPTGEDVVIGGPDVDRGGYLKVELEECMISG